MISGMAFQAKEMLLILKTKTPNMRRVIKKCKRYNLAIREKIKGIKGIRRSGSLNFEENKKPAKTKKMPAAKAGALIIGDIHVQFLVYSKALEEDKCKRTMLMDASNLKPSMAGK